MKAFPHNEFKINSLTVSATEGMDLRDYFAAQMLASVFASTTKTPPSVESIAKAAYKIADAMMEARK